MAKSKFFTNSNNNSLLKKFNGVFECMQTLYAFKAVVGYFRSSGYFLIKDKLKLLKEVKILVGINTDKLMAEMHQKGMLYYGNPEKTKEDFFNAFLEDIKKARYTPEIEEGIKDFMDDFLAGKIEIRAAKKQNIHAKFYLFLPEKHNENSDGWVIMGSSNLTDSGLGKTATSNYELNVALKDFDDVSYLHEEFKVLWNEAEPILPVDLQMAQTKIHIGQLFSPADIFYKVLIEYFGKMIEYDPESIGELPQMYKKLTYQVDAVTQGYQMLLKHNGFFLADVVGLGKTIVATTIARNFIVRNGASHTKVLVVYPPTLENTWKNAFEIFGIGKHVKFISNGSLEKIINEKDINYWKKEDYDLILVDEAHKYRNHTSAMFNNLQMICKAPRTPKGLIGGNQKKVILISATPLNNKPDDLYYQLQLFQDIRQSTVEGVTNLQDFFAPLIKEYKEIKAGKGEVSRIREIYTQIREKVISQITVRRTRKDLMNYPQYFEDIKEQGINFPEIALPKPIYYHLNDGLGTLFTQTIDYLTDKNKINYFRYQAIAFLNEEIAKQYYTKAEFVSQSLAGIMKTLMVKRLESSFVAFKKTLNNLMISTERMITMFQREKIFIAPDLRINELMDNEIEWDEIEEKIWSLNMENPRNNVFIPSDFKPEFIEGLKNDFGNLQFLCETWAKIEQDPKLDAFFEACKTEIFNADYNPSKKFVLFTESLDTAKYLQEKFEPFFKQKVLCISSENRRKMHDILLQNFDANHADPKNDYNIIIATDVLAEGINLHRSNFIINYDTPWNATKLMQRLGRVNRIGSKAKMIYNYNLYPSPQGDVQINLYKNALIKLQSFHSAYGEDTPIFTHEELVEQFKLFEEGDGDIDNEDKRLIYLRKIREFKAEYPHEFERIKNLPVKARSAVAVKAAQKNELAHSSIIFLKSSIKFQFYHVQDKGKVKTITFLEAAQILEKYSTEESQKVPKWHYAQVLAAELHFETEWTSDQSENNAISGHRDANTNIAVKILRDLRYDSPHENIKNACEKLTSLLEIGTYTNLAAEIKKQLQLYVKKQISRQKAEEIVLEINKKYSPKKIQAEDQQNVEKDLDTEIILSQMFI